MNNKKFRLFFEFMQCKQIFDNIIKKQLFPKSLDHSHNDITLGNSQLSQLLKISRN